MDAYGVGARRVRQIVGAVGRAVTSHGPPDSEAGLPQREPADSAVSSLPASVGERRELGLALVGAELDLSDHPLRAQALGVHDSLRLAREHERVPRQHGDPASPAKRAAAYRLRPLLSERARRLSLQPELSVAYPYLVVPHRPPEHLLEIVPPSQRRRGHRTDEGWLADLTSRLVDAYYSRSIGARFLAQVAVWAFSQAPGASPALEARALMVASSIARERDRLAAVWLAERVRFLMGDEDLLTLQAAHNSAIALRNHGLGMDADIVLWESMRAIKRSGLGSVDRGRMECLLLGLVSFNQTRAVLLAKDTPATLRRAQKTVEDYEEASHNLGQPSWLAAAQRAAFLLELTRALRRAKQERERPWLGSGGWNAFGRAEQAVLRSSEPMWLLQWEVLRMRVGLHLRQGDLLRDGARGFQVVAAQYPWTVRDHLSERWEYEGYRERALALKLPHVEEVEPVSTSRDLA